MQDSQIADTHKNTRQNIVQDRKWENRGYITEQKYHGNTVFFS